MGAVAHHRQIRKPLEKKGASKGIDGNLWPGAKSEGLAIVSVKARGNVGVSMIRDLRGALEREGAGIGVYLTSGAVLNCPLCRHI